MKAFRSAAFFLCLALALSAVFFAGEAEAHEVYVLDHAKIAEDVDAASPNPFGAAESEPGEFAKWGIITGAVVLGALILSLNRSLGARLQPAITKIKRFAPLVARLTLGLSLLASAYFGSLFGPELPLVQVFGPFAELVRILFYVVGALLTIGFLTRSAALVAFFIYLSAFTVDGIYLLNYINYLGEIIVNLILGSGLYSLDYFLNERKPRPHFLDVLEPYAFLFLRVLFGVAIIYASYYAKLIHSQLAIDTVVNYHLTNFFTFDPLFLVLGAFLVETSIGVFFIFGFEIRFAAIFFLTFLTMSLIYFGEAVWPHIILLGANIALFLHGYDRYTILGRIAKNRPEPVL